MKCKVMKRLLNISAALIIILLPLGALASSEVHEALLNYYRLSQEENLPEYYAAQDTSRMTPEELALRIEITTELWKKFDTVSYEVNDFSVAADDGFAVARYTLLSTVSGIADNGEIQTVDQTRDYAAILVRSEQRWKIAAVTDPETLSYLIHDGFRRRALIEAKEVASVATGGKPVPQTPLSSPTPAMGDDGRSDEPSPSTPTTAMGNDGQNDGPSPSTEEPQPAIYIPRDRFSPGEKILVRFTGHSSFSSNAWIGIIPSAIPHGNEAENDRHDMVYFYLENKPVGEFTFTAPSSPGEYDFRLHDTDDNGIEVAHVPFQVTSGEPKPAAIPSTGSAPTSLFEWIIWIESGKEVQIFLQSGQLDDAAWSGNWQTDPLGTIKAGETYTLRYENGRFVATGFHEKNQRVETHTTSGINPKDGHVSIWGRTFAFDGKGQVWDPEYGIIGKLQVQ